MISLLQVTTNATKYMCVCVFFFFWGGGGGVNRWIIITFTGEVAICPGFIFLAYDVSAVVPIISEQTFITLIAPLRRVIVAQSTPYCIVHSRCRAT